MPIIKAEDLDILEKFNEAFGASSLPWYLDEKSAIPEILGRIVTMAAKAQEPPWREEAVTAAVNVMYRQLGYQQVNQEKFDAGKAAHSEIDTSISHGEGFRQDVARNIMIGAMVSSGMSIHDAQAAAMRYVSDGSMPQRIVAESHARASASLNTDIIVRFEHGGKKHVVIVDAKLGERSATSPKYLAQLENYGERYRAIKEDSRAKFAEGHGAVEDWFGDDVKLGAVVLEADYVMGRRAALYTSSMVKTDFADSRHAEAARANIRRAFGSLEGIRAELPAIINKVMQFQTLTPHEAELLRSLKLGTSQAKAFSIGVASAKPRPVSGALEKREFEARLEPRRATVIGVDEKQYGYVTAIIGGATRTFNTIEELITGIQGQHVASIMFRQDSQRDMGRIATLMSSRGAQIHDIIAESPSAKAVLGTYSETVDLGSVKLKAGDALGKGYRFVGARTYSADRMTIVVQDAYSESSKNISLDAVKHKGKWVFNGIVPIPTNALANIRRDPTSMNRDQYRELVAREIDMSRGISIQEQIELAAEVARFGADRAGRDFMRIDLSNASPVMSTFLGSGSPVGVPVGSYNIGHTVARAILPAEDIGGEKGVVAFDLAAALGAIPGVFASDTGEYFIGSKRPAKVLIKSKRKQDAMYVMDRDGNITPVSAIREGLVESASGLRNTGQEIGITMLRGGADLTQGQMYMVLPRGTKEAFIGSDMTRNFTAPSGFKWNKALINGNAIEVVDGQIEMGEDSSGQKVMMPVSNMYSYIQFDPEQIRGVELGGTMNTTLSLAMRAYAPHGSAKGFAYKGGMATIPYDVAVKMFGEKIVGDGSSWNLVGSDDDLAKSWTGLLAAIGDVNPEIARTLNGLHGKDREFMFAELSRAWDDAFTSSTVERPQSRLMGALLAKGGEIEIGRTRALMSFQPEFTEGRKRLSPELWNVYRQFFPEYSHDIRKHSKDAQSIALSIVRSAALNASGDQLTGKIPSDILEVNDEVLKRVSQNAMGSEHGQQSRFFRELAKELGRKDSLRVLQIRGMYLPSAQALAQMSTVDPVTGEELNRLSHDAYGFIISGGGSSKLQERLMRHSKTSSVLLGRTEGELPFSTQGPVQSRTGIKAGTIFIPPEKLMAMIPGLKKTLRDIELQGGPEAVVEAMKNIYSSLANEPVISHRSPLTDPLSGVLPEAFANPFDVSNGLFDEFGSVMLGESPFGRRGWTVVTSDLLDEVRQKDYDEDLMKSSFTRGMRVMEWDGAKYLVRGSGKLSKPKEWRAAIRSGLAIPLSGEARQTNASAEQMNLAISRFQATFGEDFADHAALARGATVFFRLMRDQEIGLKYTHEALEAAGVTVERPDDKYAYMMNLVGAISKDEALYKEWYKQVAIAKPAGSQAAAILSGEERKAPANLAMSMGEISEKTVEFTQAKEAMGLSYTPLRFMISAFMRRLQDGKTLDDPNTAALYEALASASVVYQKAVDLKPLDEMVQGAFAHLYPTDSGVWNAARGEEMAPMAYDYGDYIASAGLNLSGKAREMAADVFNKAVRSNSGYLARLLYRAQKDPLIMFKEDRKLRMTPQKLLHSILNIDEGKVELQNNELATSYRDLLELVSDEMLWAMERAYKMGSLVEQEKPKTPSFANPSLGEVKEFPAMIMPQEAEILEGLKKMRPEDARRYYAEIASPTSVYAYKSFANEELAGTAVQGGVGEQQLQTILQGLTGLSELPEWLRTFMEFAKRFDDYSAQARGTFRGAGGPMAGVIEDLMDKPGHQGLAEMASRYTVSSGQIISWLQGYQRPGTSRSAGGMAETAKMVANAYNFTEEDFAGNPEVAQKYIENMRKAFLKNFAEPGSRGQQDITALLARAQSVTETYNPASLEGRRKYDRVAGDIQYVMDALMAVSKTTKEGQEGILVPGSQEWQALSEQHTQLGNAQAEVLRLKENPQAWQKMQQAMAGVTDTMKGFGASLKEATPVAETFAKQLEDLAANLKTGGARQLTRDEMEMLSRASRQRSGYSALYKSAGGYDQEAADIIDRGDAATQFITAMGEKPPAKGAKGLWEKLADPRQSFGSDMYFMMRNMRMFVEPMVSGGQQYMQYQVGMNQLRATTGAEPDLQAREVSANIGRMQLARARSGGYILSGLNGGLGEDGLGSQSIADATTIGGVSIGLGLGAGQLAAMAAGVIPALSTVVPYVMPLAIAGTAAVLTNARITGESKNEPLMQAQLLGAARQQKSRVDAILFRERPEGMSDLDWEIYQRYAEQKRAGAETGLNMLGLGAAAQKYQGRTGYGGSAQFREDLTRVDALLKGARPESATELEYIYGEGAVGPEYAGLRAMIGKEWADRKEFAYGLGSFLGVPAAKTTGRSSIDPGQVLLPEEVMKPFVDLQQRFKDGGMEAGKLNSMLINMAVSMGKVGDEIVPFIADFLEQIKGEDFQKLAGMGLLPQYMEEYAGAESNAMKLGTGPSWWAGRLLSGGLGITQREDYQRYLQLSQGLASYGVTLNEPGSLAGPGEAAAYMEKEQLVGQAGQFLYNKTVMPSDQISAVLNGLQAGGTEDNYQLRLQLRAFSGDATAAYQLQQMQSAPSNLLAINEGDAYIDRPIKMSYSSNPGRELFDRSTLPIPISAPFGKLGGVQNNIGGLGALPWFYQGMESTGQPLFATQKVFGDTSPGQAMLGQYNQQLGKLGMGSMSYIPDRQSLSIQAWQSGYDATMASIGSTIAGIKERMEKLPDIRFWQDELRTISIDSANRDLEFQQRALDLNIAQQREGFALSQEQITTKSQWLTEDTARARGRLGTQTSWQAEDYAANKAMSQMQFGWKMQDIQRDLRFATGPQREALLRQQERETIGFNFQQAQADKQFGRGMTQAGWSLEDIGINEERQRKSIEWEQRRLDMSMKYFELESALQQERINAAMEDNGRRIEAETKLRDIQREMEDNDLRRSLAAAGAQAAHAKEMHNIEGQVRAIDMLQQLMNGKQVLHLLNMGRDSSNLFASIETGTTKVQKDFEEKVNPALDLAAEKLADASGVVLQFSEGWETFGTDIETWFNVVWGGENGLWNRKFATPWHEFMNDFDLWIQGIQLPTGGGGGGGGGINPGGNNELRALGGPILHPTVSALAEHGEEYVIPSHGQLVLRGGSGRDTELLSMILATLMRIEAAGLRFVTVDARGATTGVKTDSLYMLLNTA